MKNFGVILALMLAFGIAPAKAWFASEFTQVMNNVELVMQYAKQVQQYQTQLQQYQAQLKNLEQNPGGVMKDELNGLVDNVGNVMSAQNSIGGNMGKIDSDIQKKYGNQVMGSFADKFKMWTDTSRDTLGGAMRAAGLHRGSYSSDAEALKALFNQSQSSAGSVAAIQQLSAITTMQVQQSQKLGDLLATQNIASSNWMAAQTSKAQSAIDNDAAIREGFLKAAPSSIPGIDTSKKTYTKQNLYKPL